MIVECKFSKFSLNSKLEHTERTELHWKSGMTFLFFSISGRTQSQIPVLSIYGSGRPWLVSPSYGQKMASE